MAYYLGHPVQLTRRQKITISKSISARCLSRSWRVSISYDHTPIWSDCVQRCTLAVEHKDSAITSNCTFRANVERQDNNFFRRFARDVVQGATDSRYFDGCSSQKLNPRPYWQAHSFFYFMLFVIFLNFCSAYCIGCVWHHRRPATSFDLRKYRIFSVWQIDNFTIVCELL